MNREREVIKSRAFLRQVLFVGRTSQVSTSQGTEAKSSELLWLHAALGVC